MSSGGTYEDILAAAELRALRTQVEAYRGLTELLAAEGRISAVAIYTEDRKPEGEWENTGAQFYGKPILRQAPRDYEKEKQDWLAARGFPAHDAPLPRREG